MPRGENLTTDHQKAAGRRPRLRGAALPEYVRQALEGEQLTEAQWAQIKYRIDATKLETAQLELDRERGKLVTREEALDTAQGVCQRWVAAIETLSTRVRTRVDPAYSDAVAAIVDDEVIRIRKELGGP